jgi:hypothetical protein
MYTYQGQEGPTRAPLILAEGLLWHPRQKPNTPQPIPIEIYLGITVVALLGGYAFWQSNRREMTSPLHRGIEPDFRSFPPTEHSVHQSMGEQELKSVEPNDS